MASGNRLPGQGRPKKSVLEKAEAGNPGHRPLEVLDIPVALGAVDLEGVDMPPVKEYMKSTQRNGEKLQAEEIYKEVWLWLKELGCETIVSPQMIEHYAMAQARYMYQRGISNRSTKESLHHCRQQTNRKRWMARRCPTARAVGSTALDGYELIFKGSKTGSYLTIDPIKGGLVPIGIWEIDEDSEARLDRYEGYPTFYSKKEIEVKWMGKKIKGIIYIMRPDASPGFPSFQYYNICEAGYKDFGLVEDVLDRAIRCGIGNDVESVYDERGILLI